MDSFTILPHEIIEVLGSRVMWIVYRAKDTKLERAVTLKFLPAETVTDTGHLALGEFDNYIFGSRPAVSSRQISTSTASAGFSIDEVRLLMN
jgi:hypothetical protein